MCFDKVVALMTTQLLAVVCCSTVVGQLLRHPFCRRSGGWRPIIILRYINHQSPFACEFKCIFHFMNNLLTAVFRSEKDFSNFLQHYHKHDNILSRDAEECNICDSTDYSFWTNKYMNNEWRLVTRFFFYYSRLMRNKIRPLLWLWLCIICSRVRKQRVIIKKQTPNKRASN